MREGRSHLAYFTTLCHLQRLCSLDLKMNVDGESCGIWKKMVCILFERNSPEGVQGNHRNSVKISNTE